MISETLLTSIDREFRRDLKITGWYGSSMIRTGLILDMVKEIEKLRKALKPFADIATPILNEAPPTADGFYFASQTGEHYLVTLEDFRLAQLALGN